MTRQNEERGARDTTSSSMTWLMLGSDGATGGTEAADLRRLACALAATLGLTCEGQMCFATRTGILTISAGLRRLGTMVACGTNGVLLYRQTIEGSRQIGDHFPTLLAALTALLHGVCW